MKLEEKPTAGSRWQAALLIALSLSPKPLELTDAHARACDLQLARTPGDEQLAYTTQRSLKRELVTLGLITQPRIGKHFSLAITAEGSDMAQEILDAEDWGAGGSPAAGDGAIVLEGSRIGKGHLLPRSEWARMNKLVTDGKLDIMLIPHDRVTKAQYWDERSA